jgi:hypothetical protein
MTQNEFLAKMELIDEAIHGKGQLIADQAKVAYNTYLNYRQGRGKDEKIMDAIHEAARSIALSLKNRLNSINI